MNTWIAITKNDDSASRFFHYATTTLWKLIKFYSPVELSNVYQIEEEVDFPMSIGIIGEES